MKEDAGPKMKTEGVSGQIGKTTSADKTDTKTKVEERRTQGTTLCVALICPGSVWDSGVYEGGVDHRIIVETTEVIKREHEAKSNGCRGGNQTRDPKPETQT